MYLHHTMGTGNLAMNQAITKGNPKATVIYFLFRINNTS